MYPKSPDLFSFHLHLTFFIAWLKYESIKPIKNTSYKITARDTFASPRATLSHLKLQSVYFKYLITL